MHDPRRNHDEQRGEPAEPEQDEPEQARRNTPRTLPLALHEQLAEDRDERRREGSVCDERAHRVRNQEGDLERVDRADGPEVVARDDLADEPGDPRQPGGEREDRRRPGKPPARARFVHAPSIGRGVPTPASGRLLSVGTDSAQPRAWFTNTIAAGWWARGAP